MSEQIVNVEEVFDPSYFVIEGKLSPSAMSLLAKMMEETDFSDEEMSDVEELDRLVNSAVTLEDLGRC